MKSFKYTINGNVYKVVINNIEDMVANVEVNGTPYKVEMDKPTKKQVVTIKRPAQTAVAPLTRPQQVSSGAAGLRSPLPGVILEILCKTGDSVKRGQKIMVLEAMKMENEVVAGKDGVVAGIHVNQGDTVNAGDPLITID